MDNSLYIAVAVIIGIVFVVALIRSLISLFTPYDGNGYEHIFELYEEHSERVICKGRGCNDDEAMIDLFNKARRIILSLNDADEISSDIEALKDLLARSRLGADCRKMCNDYIRDFEDQYTLAKTGFSEREKERLARKRHIAEQRRLMSDSLRYDVMKRDGFHCVLCGMSAKDGVRLHVDHIVPVSKGGMTEMSNLRTLCERCNLGKSDKIET